MNLYIEPATSTIYTRPGKSARIEYTMRNDGDPGTFLVSSMTNSPFVSIVIGENKQTSHSVFLPTGKTEKGFATVTILDTAPERDYYPQLVFGTVTGRKIEGKTSIETSQQIYSNILLTVTTTGRLDTNVSIEKFSLTGAKGRFFYDSIDEIEGDIMVKNSGENWTFVTGTVRIISPIGRVEVIQIPKQRVLGKSRSLVYTDRSGTSPHSFELQGIHIGNYKALVSIKSTDTGEKHSSVTNFTAVPFKLMGVLFIVIVLTVIFVHKLNRLPIEEEVVPEKL